MLKALSDLFDRAFGGDTEREAAGEQRSHAVELATALLMIEVERADLSEKRAERETSLALLKEFFHLTDEEANLLVEQAGAEADHAASLQGFTRRLHTALTPEEKQRIVEMLWRVALADANLDKHEDHLVRKIADLLYVSHSELIRIRNRVMEGAGA